MESGLQQFVLTVLGGAAIAFLVTVIGAVVVDNLAISSADRQTLWWVLVVSGSIVFAAGMIGAVYLDARRLARSGVLVRGSGPGTWALATALLAIVVIPMYLTARSEAVAAATTPPGHIPAKPTAGVALGGLALVLVAMMIAMSGSVAASLSSTTVASSTRSGGLTIAKYNALYTGMRLADVQATLGSPGVRESSFATGSLSVETYRWESAGAAIVVQFDHGYLVSKAQQGL